MLNFECTITDCTRAPRHRGFKGRKVKETDEKRMNVEVQSARSTETDHC